MTATFFLGGGHGRRWSLVVANFSDRRWSATSLTLSVTVPLEIFADPSNFERWSPTCHTTGPTIIAIHKIYVTAINLDGGELWWSLVVTIFLVVGGLKLVLTHV